MPNVTRRSKLVSTHAGLAISVRRKSALGWIGNERRQERV